MSILLPTADLRSGTSSGLWPGTRRPTTADPPKFERIVTFSPAFDRRSPDPAKNYGVHGVELRMVLKGELGATQFVLYTNWQLPHVTQEQLPRITSDLSLAKILLLPMPADLGYHWHAPRFTDQQAVACEYVAGGKCYYDGSSLNAEPVYEILLREGSEGVWKKLEEFYHNLAARTL